MNTSVDYIHQKFESEEQQRDGMLLLYSGAVKQGASNSIPVGLCSLDSVLFSG